MRNKALVKTPNNSDNTKSPRNAKNIAKSADTMSEKKLKQARLPFQILPSPGGDKATGSPRDSVKKSDGKPQNNGGSAAKDTTTAHRKRRLSYDTEEDDNNKGNDVKQQRRSESKENLAKDAKSKTQDSQIDEKDDDLVILSDDVDGDDLVAGAGEIKSKIDVNKEITKKAVKTLTPKNNKRRKSAGSANSKLSPKIQIKLPPKSTKNKRKKHSEEATSESYSDTVKDNEQIDVSSEDNEENHNKLHAQKKPKLDTKDAKKIESGTAASMDKENKALEIVNLDSENDENNDGKTIAEGTEGQNSKSTEDSSIQDSGNSKKDLNSTKKGGVEDKPKVKPLDAFFKNLNNNKTVKQSPKNRATEEKKKPKGQEKVENNSEPSAIKKSEDATKENDGNNLKETKEKPQGKEALENNENNELESSKETEKKSQEKATNDAAEVVEETVNLSDTDDGLETATPFNSKSNNQDNSESESSIVTDTTTKDTSFRENANPETITDTQTPLEKTKSIPKKTLTPKQQRLHDQRRKAREEKERKLQEERLQKQKEKEERELSKKREREEREDQRRKEREAREEQRRKERDEKEQRRLAEVEAKNEEKRKRNEAKEEEVRKKEEERKRKEQEKEEAELKKKKAAEAFTKFFAKAPQDQEATEKKPLESEVEKTLAFRPFQVKGAMKLAPVIRSSLNEVSRSILDSLFVHKDNDDGMPSKEVSLYLKELKSGKIKPGKWRRPSVESVVSKVDSDDVMIVEDELEKAAQPIVEEAPEPIEHLRAKYFKFSENRRPPYRGTWRKKSNIIKPTRPFAQDKQFFDYEVDSDAEWEEEEPGESLDGSDEEKDKESEDEDYEVDNEWFVPHGHLSEEEMQNDDDLANDREAQKVKMQLLQQEFAQQMKKKTEKIKPRLIGCIWVDENGNQPQDCPKIIWDTLNMRAIMTMAEPPIITEPEVAEKSNEGNSSNSPEKGNAGDKLKPIAITEAMVEDLVRLVHGNVHSRQFLIKEFIAYIEKNEDSVRNGDVRGPSKSAVHEKIDEFAQWQVIENFVADDEVKSSNKKKKHRKHLCWIVSEEVLERMGLQDLTIKNQWEYVLEPRLHKVYKSKNIVANTPTSTVASDDSNEQKSYEKSQTEPGTPKIKAKQRLDIKNFTKVLKSEEKAQQFEKTKDNNSKTAATGVDVNLDGNKEKSTSIPKNNQSPKASTAVKKRVPLLMSVARGQTISTPDKNACISQYLKQVSDKKSKEAKGLKETTSQNALASDVVVLD